MSQYCDTAQHSKNFFTIGLYHPLDGVTNLKYKLLHFLTTIFFCKSKRVIAFKWDRCCHLALCLHLILFHYSWCCFAECCYAECCYGEGHYIKCCIVLLSLFIQSFVTPNAFMLSSINIKVVMLSVIIPIVIFMSVFIQNRKIKRSLLN
jgi:hypothetical protein